MNWVSNIYFLYLSQNPSSKLLTKAVCRTAMFFVSFKIVTRSRKLFLFRVSHRKFIWRTVTELISMSSTSSFLQNLILCSTYSQHISGDNLNLSSLNVRSFTSRIVFSVKMRLVQIVSDNILSKLVTTSGVGVRRTALMSSCDMNIFARVKSLQKFAIFKIKSLFLVKSE